MELDIVQAIGSLGFPIVAYLIHIFKMDKTLQALTIAVLSLEATLKTKHI